MDVMESLEILWELNTPLVACSCACRVVASLRNAHARLPHRERRCAARQGAGAPPSSGDGTRLWALRPPPTSM